MLQRFTIMKKTVPMQKKKRRNKTARKSRRSSKNHTFGRVSPGMGIMRREDRWSSIDTEHFDTDSIYNNKWLLLMVVNGNGTEDVSWDHTDVLLLRHPQGSQLRVSQGLPWHRPGLTFGVIRPLVRDLCEALKHLHVPWIIKRSCCDSITGCMADIWFSHISLHTHIYIYAYIYIYIHLCVYAYI